MTDRRPGDAGADRETAPEHHGEESPETDETGPPEESVTAVPDCADDEHVEELPDGAGCTEIWEHLSERRAEDE